jgi:hypothetical protein
MLLKIYNKVCPDSILAKSRIDKLKGRETYDKTSRTANIGLSAVGMLLGIKNKKKFNLNLKIDKNIKPNQYENAKVNVTTIELVIVKE